MAIKDLSEVKKCLFLCNGGSCMKMNAELVTQSIRSTIKEFGLEDDYHTVRTKCMGRCDDAPVAMLSPDNVWLKNIKHKQCDLLISEIELNIMKTSESFLFKMGEKVINSESIPTKYKSTIKK
ncbi:MAG: ferredoxin [Flavobacteriales bacterium]|nr:ferredoxin [Flavobacteriales bacterium]|tara:strand:- start:2471 stop:2839 length:369 start_codon:yes stop_codon:yes gene_type:complete